MMNVEQPNWFMRQLNLFNRQPLWGRVAIILGVVVFVMLILTGDIDLLT